MVVVMQQEISFLKQQDKILNILLLLFSLFAIYKQFFINHQIDYVIVLFHGLFVWYSFFKLFIWKPNKQYKHLKFILILVASIFCYLIIKWFKDF